MMKMMTNISIFCVLHQNHLWIHYDQGEVGNAVQCSELEHNNDISLSVHVLHFIIILFRKFNMKTKCWLDDMYWDNSRTKLKPVRVKVSRLKFKSGRKTITIADPDQSSWSRNVGSKHDLAAAAVLREWFVICWRLNEFHVEPALEFLLNIDPSVSVPAFICQNNDAAPWVMKSLSVFPSLDCFWSNQD